MGKGFSLTAQPVLGVSPFTEHYIGGDILTRSFMAAQGVFPLDFLFAETTVDFSNGSILTLLPLALWESGQFSRDNGWSNRAGNIAA